MPVNLSRYINHILIDSDPDSIGSCIVTAATKLKLDVVCIATGKRSLDYATNLFPSGLDGKDCGPMPKVGQKWMLFSHGNEPPREVRVTKCPGLQEDLVVEVLSLMPKGNSTSSIRLDHFRTTATPIDEDMEEVCLGDFARDRSPSLHPYVCPATDQSPKPTP